MAETPNMTMIPTRNSRIVDSEELLGQELFLYDETTGAVHAFSSGAAMIWLLCDGTRNLEGIAAEIASVSGVPQDQVLHQVQEIVAQFHDLGLLGA